MTKPLFDPPAELAEIIAVHRRLFAGTVMMADTAGDGGAGTAGSQDGGQSGQQSGAPAKPTFQAITTPEALEHLLASERAKFADYDQLKDQAGKWQAAEAANKTELQKATDRAEKAEQALATAQAQALRSQVAAAAGLPAEMAARLQGATQAELEADAKTLATLVAKPGRTGLQLPAPGGDGAAGSKDDQARTFFGL